MKKIKQLELGKLNPKPSQTKIDKQIVPIVDPVPAGVLNNPQWEVFAQLVASAHSNTAAYMRTYGVASENVAAAAGSRLRSNKLVSYRIKELQAATAIGRVMDNTYRREMLFEIVDTPIGKVDENNRIAQKWKFSTRIDKESGNVIEDSEIQVPDKLAALRLDAQLAGELEPDASDGMGNGKFAIGPITINMIARLVQGEAVELPKTFEIDSEKV